MNIVYVNMGFAGNVRGATLNSSAEDEDIRFPSTIPALIHRFGSFKSKACLSWLEEPSEFIGP